MKALHLTQGFSAFFSFLWLLCHFILFPWLYFYLFSIKIKNSIILLFPWENAEISFWTKGFPLFFISFCTRQKYTMYISKFQYIYIYSWIKAYILYKWRPALYSWIIAIQFYMYLHHSILLVYKRKLWVFSVNLLMCFINVYS